MRPVAFSPRVETDLDDAVAWYDRQQSGLGDRFLSEFRASVSRIAQVGSALRKVHGEFRHLKFDGFPYLIYFRDDREGFYVALVINAARDPALILRLLEDRSKS
jgi:plasmid stabilization system protein ParE